MATSFHDEDPDDKYVDKKQVTYCKNIDLLERFANEHPDDLNEALTHLRSCLDSTKELNNDMVTVELHIEERASSHDPVDFRCSPRWTVFAMKIKISETFPRFEKENLYVLYKRTIAEDWMYLEECGVQMNGDVLYVYVHVPNRKGRLRPQQNREIRPGFQQAASSSGSKSIPPSFLNNQKEPLYSPNGNGSLGIADVNFIDKNTNNDMGELWTCPNCTFLNESWRPGCCMCSSERPGFNVMDEIPKEQMIMVGQPAEESVEIMNTEMEPVAEEIPKPGWKCLQCTFLNEPTRPGCEMCSGTRPEDYKIPDGYVLSVNEVEWMNREVELEEEAERERSLERKQNYEKHMLVVDKSIITSFEPVECLICFTETEPADTIVLRECLHRFCKECITNLIINCEEAVVMCPYADDDYKCDYIVTQREIKALLTEEQFQKHLERGLSQAENSTPNSYHCKTPDCKGWCEYDDQVNTFHCPVCEKRNCLTCKAIHENRNCKQYQEELELKSTTDREALETRKFLEKMVEDGEAMHCPQCNIIIQKKIGCDWIRCPMCKLEICWVTKGPRWGPKGRGDNSGGCHCREFGRRCHKDCGNCH